MGFRVHTHFCEHIKITYICWHQYSGVLRYISTCTHNKTHFLELEVKYFEAPKLCWNVWYQPLKWSIICYTLCSNYFRVSNRMFPHFFFFYSQWQMFEMFSKCRLCIHLLHIIWVANGLNNFSLILKNRPATFNFFDWVVHTAQLKTKTI